MSHPETKPARRAAISSTRVIVGNFSECASRRTRISEPAHVSLMAAARAEILHGLRQNAKAIPAKYLYDARGAELFERICELPEYYVTRAELSAMRRHLPHIATALGDDILLIEPGAGAARKVRLLLGIPGLAAGYVPVDICESSLAAAAASLRNACPAVEIRSVCADFTRPFTVPAIAKPYSRRVVFFPGSTIGNCTPAEAVDLLAFFRRLAGPGGGILIGVDLYKSPDVLIPAYNDSQGVTALFNLNLLHRLNRDFSADFRPERFSHRAVWNEDEHRIEMRLISRTHQRVHVGPHAFDFAAGEYLTTEYSYKHTREDFARIAWQAGLAVREFWTDCSELFSLQFLRPAN